MSLRPRFVINTTIIVCLAFIFRLVFVNTALFLSVNGSQTFKLSRSYMPNYHKKKVGSTDPVVSADITIYPEVQVCDADAGSEKDPTKDKMPAVQSLFHSFFNPQTDVIQSSTSFDCIKCSLYPKKYLSLSILRV